VETKILVTMNARELRHLFTLRCCLRAQWEIRGTAEAMLALAREAAPALFAKAGPACVAGPCPEGKLTCGKIEEVRARYRPMGAAAGAAEGV
jgi:thymidylate synthase (FAD)